MITARTLYVVGSLALAPLCARAVTLAELEARVGQSVQMRDVEAQLAVAQARDAAARADTGIRLFGSMSLAHGRDAARPERYLIENVQPDGAITAREQVLTPLPVARSRAAAQIGIRLPLFGSRQVLDEAAAQTGAAIELQRYRRKVVELEVLKALRYAYADAYYRSLEAHLARHYLQREPAARRYLDARTARGMILADEQRRLLATFSEAAQHDAEAGAAVDKALAAIHAITDMKISAGDLAAPALRVHCLSVLTLQAAIEGHPDIAYYTAQAELRRRDIGAAAAGAVEGALSFSQGASRDPGGRSGYSGNVAVDVSIPLDLARWRATRRDVALAEFQRARLALDIRRTEYRAGLDDATRAVDAARKRLEAAHQRLDAETEGVRIAELRVARARSEGEEPLIRMRAARYSAARALAQAGLALAQREADLLGFGHQCQGGPPDGGEGLRLDKALNAAGLELAGPADVERIAPAQKADLLGWYAWRLFDRIATDDPVRVLQALPPAERILLSMTRTQIESAAPGGPNRQQLRRFLDAARRGGMRVELLLGEPLWALPEHHAEVSSIIDTMAALPFAGIHLDIEREQLALTQRARWSGGLATLVQRLGKASKLPLALSIHPRDATAGFLRMLAAHGVAEVTVMYYSTRADQVGALLARLMREHPDLGFSVGQSIEPELPASASYARLDRVATLAALRRVGDPLRAQLNFHGVVVQSIDHFLERSDED